MYAGVQWSEVAPAEQLPDSGLFDARPLGCLFGSDDRCGHRGGIPGTWPEGGRCPGAGNGEQRARRRNPRESNHRPPSQRPAGAAGLQPPTWAWFGQVRLPRSSKTKTLSWLGGFKHRSSHFRIQLSELRTKTRHHC
jgi:hypothetical protein